MSPVRGDVIQGDGMPARIVVALNEPGFADKTVLLLQERGFDAKALADSMAALDALEGAYLIELLVTCPNFPDGKPNGVALARIARARRPGIKVLFVGPTELEHYTEGLGAYRHSPITVDDVADAAIDVLTTPEPPERAPR
jgi:hypothetical protein